MQMPETGDKTQDSSNVDSTVVTDKLGTTTDVATTISIEVTIAASTTADSTEGSATIAPEFTSATADPGSIMASRMKR